MVVLVVMETKRLSLSPSVPTSPANESGALHRIAEPYIPFNMVAGGEEDINQLFPARLSTGEQRPAQFWGTKYSPRTQKANGRELWREDVLESLRINNIPASILLKPPPTIRDIDIELPN